jgi:hypothetical protein
VVAWLSKGEKLNKKSRRRNPPALRQKKPLIEATFKPKEKTMRTTVSAEKM